VPPTTNGVISKFNYEYDVNGQITKWTQQADADTSKAFNFAYDAVDQLVAATVTTNVTAVLKRYAYAYDKAGNRTSEQIDNAVTKATHNNLNQLVSQAGSGGPMRFLGTVSEPAIVTLTCHRANQNQPLAGGSKPAT